MMMKNQKFKKINHFSIQKKNKKKKNKNYKKNKKNKKLKDLCKQM